MSDGLKMVLGGLVAFVQIVTLTLASYGLNETVNNKVETQGLKSQVIALLLANVALEKRSNSVEVVQGARGERITKLEVEASGMRQTLERLEKTLDRVAEKVGASKN